MKKPGVLIAIAFLGLALTASGEDTKKKPAAKAAGGGGKAVLMAPDDMKWVDAPNSPPGVKMAVMAGDPAKGKHKVFHKLPGGFSSPMHSHTADHVGVVVSGTLAMQPEGGEEKKLPAGSWFTYTGKKKHTTKCEAGADCVIYGVAQGAWDVVMDEKK